MTILRRMPWSHGYCLENVNQFPICLFLNNTTSCKIRPVNFFFLTVLEAIVLWTVSEDLPKRPPCISLLPALLRCLEVRLTLHAGTQCKSLMRAFERVIFPLPDAVPSQCTAAAVVFSFLFQETRGESGMQHIGPSSSFCRSSSGALSESESCSYSRIGDWRAKDTDIACVWVLLVISSMVL